MSVLITFVIMIALSAILVNFMGGSKKSKKVNPKNAGKARAAALKEAQRKLSKDPNDASALEVVGDAYFSSNLWDKAFPVYDKLSKLGVKDGHIDIVKAFLRSGICCMKMENYQQALQFFTSAYKLNAADFDVCYNFGIALFKSNIFDKAIPLFKKAVLIKPETPGINMYLAKSLYNGKKYKESLGSFKKVLDEDPHNKEALFFMSDAMAQEGHAEKALKVFMHLRADPVYGPRSCLQAGLYHKKINSVDAAVQDFEIALKHTEIDPVLKTEIQYNLARCYLEKAQIQKGLMLLKSIRSTNENYKDVNSLIGRYQELSQNSNLNVYVSSGTGDFVNLCRKIITTKYRNSQIRFQNIETEVLYTDILAEISSAKWEDVALFRFFRTTGTTGEVYVREFHSHMQDVKAARGFCFSAGTFTQEGHKYIEGRPIDLIEKTELTKILKQITL